MNKYVLLSALICPVMLGLVSLSYGDEADWARKPGLYAVFKTNQGEIVCRLFEKETPVTVKNFVELATGKKSWTHSLTGETKKSSFYDGLVFHRVIPNFMIQGGDPLGNGAGGPGYKFQDEIAPSLKFNTTGKLAMANSGPGTNGSQFFITVAPTPWLDGHHTIFGQVVKGQGVADKIANVARDGQDKPLAPVVIEKLTIKRNK